MPNSPLIPIREVKIELPDYLENIPFYPQDDDKILRKRTFNEINPKVNASSIKEGKNSTRKNVKISSK